MVEPKRAKVINNCIATRIHVKKNQPMLLEMETANSIKQKKKTFDLIR